MAPEMKKWARTPYSLKGAGTGTGTGIVQGREINEGPICSGVPLERADANSIQFLRGNTLFFVDFGGMKTSKIAYADFKEAKKVVIIITHPHQDHASSFESLVKKVLENSRANVNVIADPATSHYLNMSSKFLPLMEEYEKRIVLNTLKFGESLRIEVGNNIDNNAGNLNNGNEKNERVVVVRNYPAAHLPREVGSANYYFEEPGTGWSYGHLAEDGGRAKEILKGELGKQFLRDYSHSSVNLIDATQFFKEGEGAPLSINEAEREIGEYIKELAARKWKIIHFNVSGTAMIGLARGVAECLAGCAGVDEEMGQAIPIVYTSNVSGYARVLGRYHKIYPITDSTGKSPAYVMHYEFTDCVGSARERDIYFTSNLARLATFLSNGIIQNDEKAVNYFLYKRAIIISPGKLEIYPVKGAWEFSADTYGLRLFSHLIWHKDAEHILVDIVGTARSPFAKKVLAGGWIKIPLHSIGSLGLLKNVALRPCKIAAHVVNTRKSDHWLRDDIMTVLSAIADEAQRTGNIIEVGGKKKVNTTLMFTNASLPDKIQNGAMGALAKLKEVFKSILIPKDGKLFDICSAPLEYLGNENIRKCIETGKGYVVDQ